MDIDYPQLLEKKKGTVLATPELNRVLTNLNSVQKNEVLLQSDQYFQIACDLREIPTLSKILESLFNFQDSLVLFTAEVSITYMRLPYADNLIQFAGTFQNGMFLSILLILIRSLINSIFAYQHRHLSNQLLCSYKMRRKQADH